jgi:hypothetical protein
VPTSAQCDREPLRLKALESHAKLAMLLATSYARLSQLFDEYRILYEEASAEQRLWPAKIKGVLVHNRQANGPRQWLVCASSVRFSNG